jgi:hypothetical protein
LRLGLLLGGRVGLVVAEVEQRAATARRRRGADVLSLRSSVAVDVPPEPDFASEAACLALGLDSPFTAASSSWATSRTSTSSWASPLLWAEVRPSESITRQKGQPVAILAAPVPTASAVRVSVIRVPMVSSIHMRAPPAPQQKDRSWLRGISTNLVSGKTLSSSRGAS